MLFRSTGTLDATGLVLPKHGSVDLKLEVDTAKLNEKFKTWTSKTHKFYAKGTMNMWTPVQLLDDGKKGDEGAADGKFTYVQSKNLGKHDGLLNAKGEVQFIFVTTTGNFNIFRVLGHALQRCATTAAASYSARRGP